MKIFKAVIDVLSTLKFNVRACLEVQFLVTYYLRAPNVPNPGIKPPVSLYTKLRGPGNQSEHYGESKNACPCRDPNPGPQARGDMTNRVLPLT
jgi:hypothetical protein